MMYVMCSDSFHVDGRRPDVNGDDGQSYLLELLDPKYLLGEKVSVSF